MIHVQYLYKHFVSIYLMQGQAHYAFEKPILERNFGGWSVRLSQQMRKSKLWSDYFIQDEYSMTKAQLDMWWVFQSLAQVGVYHFEIINKTACIVMLKRNV